MTIPRLRQVVLDSAGPPVAVIETIAVRVMRLADVDLDHALGEGAGSTSVAEWRAGHERFWHSAEMRQAVGDPAFTVGDDTRVVASEFRLYKAEDGAPVKMAARSCRGGQGGNPASPA